MKRATYSQSHASQARASRRTAGDARNTAWRALSFVAQVASLDSRLGVGIGAVRQRAKLGLALSVAR